MAEETVEQLARARGEPVKELLGQLAEAGLDARTAEDVLTAAERATLLAHLEQAAGDGGAPRKITLKRRETSTLKTSSASGRGRTVNVEVRKKRTYVKDADGEPAPAAKPALALDDAERRRQEAAVQRRAEEAQWQEEKKAHQQEAAEAKAERAKAKQARKGKAEEEPKAAGKTEGRKPAGQQPAGRKAGDKKPAGRKSAASAADAKKAEKPAKAKQDDSRPAEPALQDAKPSARKDKRDRHDLDTEDPQQKKAKQSTRKRRVEDLMEEGLRELSEAEALAALEEEEDTEAATEAAAPEAAEAAEPAEAAEVAEPVEAAAAKQPEAAKPSSTPLGLSAPRRKRGRAQSRRHAFQAPTEKIKRQVEIADSITVQQLSQRMSVKASEVITTLFNLGIVKTINEPVEQEAAALVVEEFGHSVKLLEADQVEKRLEEDIAYEAAAEHRAPVVTVMGHVDHGKTSLLDRIRKSQVAEGEAGGITQHIGAYRVQTEQGEICFIDTPGHAAFTAMRARGANATDIVILVVAADDGVMPQTEEAIQHAQGAQVPLVVAVNKMDKEGADPEKVRNELAAKEVVSEAWGGDTQFVQVSAATGDGVQELLEAVLLQAELLELSAAPKGPARGLVLESRLDKHRGPVATLLVQEGSLQQGDVLVAGRQFGRARALCDENGQPLQAAGPATPVAVLGLNGTPDAGDSFLVAKDERRAREVADFRTGKAKEVRYSASASLDRLAGSFGENQVQTLTLVVKADVRGSLEAIVSALGELGNDEVKVHVAIQGVGGITESDAHYAVTAGAVLFGFNVRADKAAKQVIEAERLDLRYYKVIYDLVDDVKAALSGMLSPELREEIVGVAEVREVFASKKLGQIAGCVVTEGTVIGSKKIRVLRDSVVIYEGELESLRRFKEEVDKVASGTECGIGVRDYNDVRVGDLIEVFDTHEVAREL